MTSAHVEFYKGKICGVFLVIFICGVAAGGVGMKAYMNYSAEPQQAGVDLGPSDEHERVMEELKVELELNDKQYSEVRSVLDQCIMQEADMLSQIESLRSEGRSRIEKILNPQQRETFRAHYVVPVGQP